MKVPLRLRHVIFECGHSLAYLPSGPVAHRKRPQRKAETDVRESNEVSCRERGSRHSDVFEILHEEGDALAIYHQTFGCEVLRTSEVSSSDSFRLVVEWEGVGRQESGVTSKYRPAVEPGGIYILSDPVFRS